MAKTRRARIDAENGRRRVTRPRLRIIVEETRGILTGYLRAPCDAVKYDRESRKISTQHINGPGDGEVETGVFQRRKKKNSAAPPNFTSRTRTNRHNASDVRCEGGVRSRAVCIGRGGVVTAQRRRSTAANWGSFFFSSVECTHRPLLRGYDHGHISRVAFLSCVHFSRHAVCSCGSRRLALCT